MCELLSPVGNKETLDAAINNGADAVYLGLKSFNARLRSTNFSFRQLNAIVEVLHKMNKKVYLTLNTVIEEKDTERIYRLLSYLQEIGVDALIVQDFSIIRMAHAFFPSLILHASTQMNVGSIEGINALSKAGVRRVVLPRELNLEEVRTIKERVNTELEVFIHGSLCISESGLCLFSSMLGGKSANKGECTQCCRRLFYAQYEEEERAGYYFSPTDLSLAPYLPSLVEAGISSLKIEGRMKSAEYVAVTTRAYRYLLDNYKTDLKGSIETCKRILTEDFGRKSTSYFYDFPNTQEGIKKVLNKTLDPSQAGGTGIYLGVISKVINKKDVVLGCIENITYSLDVGDSIRIHSATDTARYSVKIKEVTSDNYFTVAAETKKGDAVYLLQVKVKKERLVRVLPKDLTKYKKEPPDIKLPILDLTRLNKEEERRVSKGLFVAVSEIKDLHIALSFSPSAVILEFNKDTRSVLLKGSVVLPITKSKVFIKLDPFCTPTSEEVLQQDLTTLLTLGYTSYVVNNLSHIKILNKCYKSISDKKTLDTLTLIAGEYLYTFNRYAISFLENMGLRIFISPYENSKKNLLNTYTYKLRGKCILPIFSYPILFRIRGVLPASYDFQYFSDKKEGIFKLNNTTDGAFVISEKPFSIVDKVQELEQDGFTRFLIDFTKTTLSRRQVKAIDKALSTKTPLPNCTRFNFFDGFFVRRDNKVKEDSNKR